LGASVQERVVDFTSPVLTDIDAYKVPLNELPAVGTNIPDKKNPAHHPGQVHSTPLFFIPGCSLLRIHLLAVPHQ